MPLRREDRAKTAFGTLWGLYEFKRMPFRLHGVDTTFQRLINWVLGPHQQYVAAYINDIRVYTQGWEESGATGITLSQTYGQPKKVHPG